ALERVDAEMRAALDGDEVGEWQRVADVRYRGQNWSIPVDFPDGMPLAEVVERFEAEHELLYGTRLEPGSPVDVRALRLVALGPERGAFALDHASVYEPATATRLAYFDGELLDVPVRSRASLVGDPQSGPLLVDEYDTTVVVPPGWSVALDEATGALLLEFLTSKVPDTAVHAAPIAVRLVANALETAADEMATTVFRTAHSAVVRD